MTTSFITGSIFLPKVPKFLIGLAESRKEQERLRAYLHDGSTDKHKIYLKLSLQNLPRISHLILLFYINHQ